MSKYKAGQIWERGFDGARLKILAVRDGEFDYRWLVTVPNNEARAGYIGTVEGLFDGWKLYDPYPALYDRMIELIEHGVS